MVSGTSAGVEALLNKVKCRRIVSLEVSGAFHSPLMADVSFKFNQILQTVTFQSAKIPVISNVEPSPTTDAAILKERLMQQMTGQVRWREIINSLVKENVKKVVEIGPGLVLTNMILKMHPNMKVDNVSSNTAIRALQKKLVLL